MQSITENYNSRIEDVEKDQFDLMNDVADLVLLLMDSSSLDEVTKEKLQERFFKSSADKNGKA